MNELILTAIVNGDLRYTDEAEYEKLPIRLDGGPREMLCDINILEDCSRHPDGNLEEGEEIQIIGELRIVDGALIPYAKEITRCDEDDDWIERIEDE